MALIWRTRAAAGLLAGISLFVCAPAAWASASRSLIGVGYYVDFDPNSWTAVRTEGQRLNWVITTNYVFADPTGRLAGSHDAGIVSLARSRGSRVHFQVANLSGDAYDAGLAHAILTSPAASIRAIASILQVLRDYAYDGVVLDLQNVLPSDRKAFADFVSDLAAQLHGRGRPLSLVVPAKAAPASRPDADAYDLKALGRAADWLILRAYDDQRAAGPVGPLAPLPWVEAAIKNMIARVPASKVLLGISLLGYDWPQQGTGENISMREALGRARRGGAEIMWDELAQTPYFTLFGRTVYFEDARSVERKLSLAARYRLGGTAFWRLGCETPDLWTMASAYLRPQERAVSSTR